jgi:hypothetical protein
MISVLIEMEAATLHELQTIYDSEAAADLLEIAIVKRANQMRGE